MKTVKRSNGIIIRDFPSFRALKADVRLTLEDALEQLAKMRKNTRVASWDWSDKVYIIDRPGSPLVAETPQLLRVIGGAGTIFSGGLEDSLDYGYWVFVPKGVEHTLRGRVISGMNFRVITLALK
jgi:hypothetical protein